MKSDSGLVQYIAAHTSPEDALLTQLYRETHLKALYPRMLSGHYQGKFLELISKISKPKFVLEIGTYTGYSAICLAKGLADNGKVHTIERNDEIINLTKKYFIKSGFGNRIELHVGDALQVIPKLPYEFDLVFIDGDKKEYPEYYRLVIDKVRPGGIILADNVLWSGKVLTDNKNTDPETKSIKTFNAMIQNDERVENILFPFRDGVMMMRKTT